MIFLSLNKIRAAALEFVDRRGPKLVPEQDVLDELIPMVGAMAAGIALHLNVSRGLLNQEIHEGRKFLSIPDEIIERIKAADVHQKQKARARFN